MAHEEKIVLEDFSRLERGKRFLHLAERVAHPSGLSAGPPLYEYFATASRAVAVIEETVVFDLRRRVDEARGKRLFISEAYEKRTGQPGSG